MILIMLIVFVGIAFYELPRLFKNRYWKDIIVFFFFYITAFTLTLLLILHVKIPSPAKAIVHLIKDTLHLDFYERE